MKNLWSLYFSGVGGIDAAETMLTNLVTRLRDLGLTVTNVQAVEGELHPDLGDVGATEDGWTMYAFGEGAITDDVYRVFPEALAEFEQNGISVLHSGITAGAARNIPVPA